jgi:cold shock CspA family protein
VVRFDGVRGYGFITPDQGGEDVFLHVNDLEIEKALVKSGVRVSFDIEEGTRGKLATGVRLEAGDSAETRADEVATHIDGYFDVLSVEEFSMAITEMLLLTQPPLASSQILDIRAAFQQLGVKQGWIEP